VAAEGAVMEEIVQLRIENKQQKQEINALQGQINHEKKLFVGVMDRQLKSKRKAVENLRNEVTPT
jgi:hypothetical protein